MANREMAEAEQFLLIFYIVLIVNQLIRLYRIKTFMQKIDLHEIHGFSFKYQSIIDILIRNYKKII